MIENVVIIHLESLNTVTFFLHPEWFPNLIFLKNSSRYYMNYFSTATSTYMVTTDLMFGDTGQFEGSSYLEDIFSVQPKKESLLRILKDKGFAGKIYAYGFPKDDDLRGYINVLGRGLEFWRGDNHDDLSLALREQFQKGAFVAFIQDDESHLEALPRHKESSYEACEHRFRHLDATIGKITDTIKKANKFESTLMVLYGDHGDDFWGHGVHDGYAHATEPYYNLIHCPLIVYHPEMTQSTCSQLISTEDISNLILGFLGNQELLEKRELAYSRNLFVNQNLCENSFNKSYSVTDGKFLLMVSNKGLSLFYNAIDFYNAKNMLDFFEYKNGNLKYVAANDLLNGSHFHYFMTTETKKEISDVFYRLRGKLIEYVTKKYGEKKVDMNFETINYSFIERMPMKEYILRRIKTGVKRLMNA